MNGEILKGHKSLTVFTDGSYNRNAKRSGYAIIYLGGDKELLGVQYGGFTPEEGENGWNVNAELNAVMTAVETAITAGAEEITINYDYIGVEKWATKEWKRNKSYTIEYAQAMEEYMEEIKISFRHIKGHSKNLFNDLADKYAKKAVELTTDEIYWAEEDSMTEKTSKRSKAKKETKTENGKKPEKTPKTATAEKEELKTANEQGTGTKEPDADTPADACEAQHQDPEYDIRDMEEALEEYEPDYDCLDALYPEENEALYTWEEDEPHEDMESGDDNWPYDNFTPDDDVFCPDESDYGDYDALVALEAEEAQEHHDDDIGAMNEEDPILGLDLNSLPEEEKEENKEDKTRRMLEEKVNANRKDLPNGDELHRKKLDYPNLGVFRDSELPPSVFEPMDGRGQNQSSETGMGVLGKSRRDLLQKEYKNHKFTIIYRKEDETLEEFVGRGCFVADRLSCDASIQILNERTIIIFYMGEAEGQQLPVKHD